MVQRWFLVLLITLGIPAYGDRSSDFAYDPDFSGRRRQVTNTSKPIKASVDPYKYPLFYRATRLGPVNFQVGAGAAVAWELFDAINWRTGVLVKRREQVGSQWLMLPSISPQWSLQTGPVLEF